MQQTQDTTVVLFVSVSFLNLFIYSTTSTKIVSTLELPISHDSLHVLYHESVPPAIMWPFQAARKLLSTIMANPREKGVVFCRYEETFVKSCLVMALMAH